MKKVVFVGLRGFGSVLVKPNKNAILSVCHYFWRLLKRARYLQRCSGDPERPKCRETGSAVSLNQNRLQDWRKPNAALKDGVFGPGFFD